MKKINVGIASFGMSGKVFHAPLLAANNGYNLVGIVERNRDHSKEKYPNAHIFRSFDELLAFPNIELVIVNTPNEFHYSMGKQALEAGKHVVMEKPFTNTSAEAEELIQIAKQQNRILSVFQNRRWDSDFLTVKKLVHDQLLGRLVNYEAYYDRYRKEVKSGTWKEEEKEGSGILYNLGSHLIDQALILFQNPTSISATLSKQRANSLVYDAYDVILFYPNKHVRLRSSYLVRELGPRYILHGTNGSFVKHGLDVQEEDLIQGKSINSLDWGHELQKNWGILNTSLNDLHFRGTITSIAGNYSLFYDKLYKAICFGEEVPVKAEEAMNVIRVIEKAYQSHDEKRVVNW